MENRVRSIVHQHSIKTKKKNVFFTPNIPKMKLHNAIQSYATIGDNEKPLILVDRTLTGSGKTGLLLTDRKIHSGTSFLYDGDNFSYKKMSFELQNISTVCLLKDKKGSFVYVNGVRFFMGAFKPIYDILKEIVTCLNLDAKNLSDLEVSYDAKYIGGYGEIPGTECCLEVYPDSIKIQQIGLGIPWSNIKDFYIHKSLKNVIWETSKWGVLTSMVFPSLAVPMAVMTAIENWGTAFMRLTFTDKTGDAHHMVFAVKNIEVASVLERYCTHVKSVENEENK